MYPSFSSEIKIQAQKLGFQKTGIARASSTPREKADLDEWLALGKYGTMEWMKKRQKERGNIFHYFPEAKSVIALGMNYFSGYTQEDLPSAFKISNYAWGDDYHLVMKSQLFKLLKWIEESSPGIKGLVCVDTAPVMDKVWGSAAGLGWIGKHTNLISRDYGSWLFLGELILDIELKYDLPFSENLCGSCSACIDACPTQALEDYKIDARKCISYLSIEFRGEIDPDKQDFNGWIYGCDICQEVCPWNKKFEQVTDKLAFQPKREILEYSKKNWQELEEEEFRKLFSKSAIKRTKFAGLMRNINLNTKHQQ